jgi:hypothetical protein
MVGSRVMNVLSSKSASTEEKDVSYPVFILLASSIRFLNKLSSYYDSDNSFLPCGFRHVL